MYVDLERPRTATKRLELFVDDLSRIHVTVELPPMLGVFVPLVRSSHMILASGELFSHCTKIASAWKLDDPDSAKDNIPPI